MALINVGETITVTQYANADTTPQISNAYLFYVDIKLNSQDIVNNKSNITITHRMKAVRANYSNYSQTYSTVQIGSEVKATKYQSNASKNVTYTLASWTGDVEHNANGELALTINGVWHGYDDGSSYSAVSNTLANAVELPQIRRASTIEVTPALLKTGGTMQIAITRFDNSYLMTTKYEVNNTVVVLGEKVSTLSYSVSYETIKALVGSFTSADILVTCETFNSDDESLGITAKVISIQTGVVPASFYDDRQGNVGVTFGEEATEPDVHFKLPAFLHNNIPFFVRDSADDDKSAMKMTTTDVLEIGANSNQTSIKGYEVSLLNSTSGNVKLEKGDSVFDGFLRPETELVTLGKTAKPFYRLYAKNSTQIVSDEREKKYINELDNKYENLFNSLNPKRFKMRKDDNNWRIGFIAQEVEQAVNGAGLSNMGVVEHSFFEDEKGNDIDRYSLAYTEFIALNTYMLKKAFLKIEELERKITELEEKIKV